MKIHINPVSSKVKRSNSAHASIIRRLPVSRNRDQKVFYHSSVSVEQRRLNRILTRQEKRAIWNAAKKVGSGISPAAKIY